MATIASDDRYLWIKERVLLTLCVTGDVFSDALKVEAHQHILTQFLDGDSQRIVIYQKVLAGKPEVFVCKDTGIVGASGKICCLSKITPGPINEGYRSQVILTEIDSDSVNHLLLALENVYHPMLIASRSPVVPKDVILKTQEVAVQLCSSLSSIQQRTRICNPLALNGVTGSDQALSQNKDLLLQLESCAIIWLRQIKNSLAAEAEDVLGAHDSHSRGGLQADTKSRWPNPMHEIEYWDNRSADLDSLHSQLTSNRVTSAITILQLSNSSLSIPLSRAFMNVKLSAEEAKNCFAFVSALKSTVDPFCSDGPFSEADYQDLRQAIPSIWHIIFLIWKHSVHYGQSHRISVIIRLLVNMTLHCTYKFTRVSEIFEEANPEKFMQRISTSQQLLHCLRQSYVKYKTRTSTMTNRHNPPWTFNETSLFSALTDFEERMQYVHEVAQTWSMYLVLKDIEVPGPGGEKLTFSLQQVFDDFQKALRVLLKTQDLLLSLSADFAQNLGVFKSKIADYDKRITSILHRALASSQSLDLCYRVLSAFGILLNRDALRHTVRSFHYSLLQLLTAQLHASSENFELNKESGGCIPVNMPPTAGAVAWARCLQDRVRIPLELFTSLDPEIFSTDDGKVCTQQCQAFISLLQDFQDRLIQLFSADINSKVKVKLKQNLLHRDVHNMLHVNFDPQIVRLLREVKYFYQFGIHVPDEAKAVYDRAEVLRTQTGNLTLIVNMYNTMQTSILDVERPLLQTRIADIEASLEKGLSSLTWRSPGVSEFISLAMKDSKELSSTVSTIKANMRDARRLVSNWESWSYLPVQDQQTFFVSDLTAEIKESTAAMFKVMSEAGFQINQLIQQNMSLFGTSKTSPLWKAYVSHMQGIIISDVVQVSCSCMRKLAQRIDKDYFGQTEAVPLLELKLEMFPGGPQFVPVVPPSSVVLPKSVVSGLICPARDGQYLPGLFGLIELWISEISSIGKFLAKLDGSEGDLQEDVQTNAAVQLEMLTVWKHAQEAAQGCESFLAQYGEYAYLWTNDPQEGFNEFLKSGPQKRPQSPSKDAKELVSWHVPIADGAPLISSFYKKLTMFSTKQEIVKETPASLSLGFIRIDARPMKNAIVSFLQKWSHCYSSYLEHFISERLQFASTYIKQANTRLNAVASENADSSLFHLEQFKLIQDIRSRDRISTGSVDNPFEFSSLKFASEVLASSGKVVPDDILHQIEDSPAQWLLLQKLAIKKKDDLEEYSTKESQNISQRSSSCAALAAEFIAMLKSSDVYKGGCTIEHSYSCMMDMHNELSKIESEQHDVIEMEKLFELATSSAADLIQSRSLLLWCKNVWDMMQMVNCVFQDWGQLLLNGIDVESLISECSQFQKQFKQLPAGARNIPVFKEVEILVKNMMMSLPLLSSLLSPAMRDRHWFQLSKLTGVVVRLDQGLKLVDLFALQLHRFADDVGAIVDSAGKELIIENNLKKITTIWNSMSVEFVPHTDNEVQLLQVPEILTEQLEEHMVVLQGMQSSRFLAHFGQHVNELQVKLATVESVLQSWIELQRKWVRLQSIFVGTADIRKQLVEDTRRFDLIHQQFKELMKNASSNSKIATNICLVPGRLDSIEYMVSQFQICEKALTQYLEVKRKRFPRFYFVSSADLLDILAKASVSPFLILRHLSKCFDNMQSLSFQKNSDGENTTNATVMISKENEEVKLHEAFPCEGAVEDWLLALVDCMRQSLKVILKSANRTPTRGIDDFVLNFCAQISILAYQILWSSEVEAAFDKMEQGKENAMQQALIQVEGRLAALTESTQRDLSAGDRSKIVTLITMEVHSRDVTQTLVDTKVDSITAFAWLSQLRYYSSDTIESQAKIADASFLYGFEYIGNCGRLVITPLTDRCYITLTQALRLNMGGAPAGPAGTGKTETTKDLGRGLGMPVYVFNCSEQMDYKSMGSIFMGLSQTGAWGCFDEFNRISLDVLSVVATQVKSVLDAVRARLNRFNFSGEDLLLVRSVGIFITMNPGYAGRVELPENIKSLFRPVSMIVPDFKSICEIMLYSEGFLEAKPLALKFVKLYSLNRELLSKQDHYDWGLRAIKSVLVVAGSLKRASLSDASITEDMVLMRALRDLNLPKIAYEDVSTFSGLITDLFPKLSCPRLPNVSLATAVLTCCEADSTTPVDGFVLKVTQLQELLDVRHSVFVLGPGGSGKSTVWRMLAKANHELGRKTHVQILNPKAITTNELYGYVNPSTREWKDGVFSIIMREFAEATLGQDAKADPRWIVLDGDIDANWIESLNTVMDDNKVLTLASNERIPLTRPMRLVFEIGNLKYASPATVSRAGILFLNDADIGYKVLITSWLKKFQALKPENLSVLQSLFDTHLAPSIALLRRDFKTITPIRDVALVVTIFRLVDALCSHASCTLENEQQFLTRAFEYSLIWSLGGTLAPSKNSDVMLSFSNAFRKVVPSLGMPDSAESKTIFDYCFDPKSQSYITWADIVKIREPYVHDPELPFYSRINVTVDMMRSIDICKLLLHNKHPVMICGGAGTGKSQLLQRALKQVSDDIMPVGVSLNFYTDAKALQAILEAPLEKKAGKVFGPPGSRDIVYCIDDVNMPKVDTYGTQSALALVRQHMDHGMWYDMTKMSQKEVRNCQYVCSMNPTSGSFTIDERLQHHFVVLSCFMPNAVALVGLFTPILQGHFIPFDISIQKLGERLLECTVELFKKVADSFLPTTQKFFYQFSLRDIVAVVSGLCRCAPSTIKSPQQLFNLWSHECNRVFGDRLITINDFKLMCKMIEDVAKRNFQGSSSAEWGVIDYNFVPTIMFSEVYNGPGTGNEGDAYMDVKDFSVLSSLLKTKLDEYNDTNTVMDLVLFEQAVQHVCRISRILSQPRGNCLLVGVGGSGKQSLARLASYLCDLSVYQITVSSTYGASQFKDDLGQLYMKVGVKNISYAFILTDSQVVDDGILVMINDVLSSGNVNDLLSKEDRDTCTNSVRGRAKEAGILDTPQNLWQFFIDDVRDRLHLVLCFSPSDTFRSWARKFPALVSCSSIDVFSSWPQDALVSVAQNSLKSIFDVDKSDDKESENSQFLEAISQSLAFIHESSAGASEKLKAVYRRYNYTTPKSFLEMIALYKSLLSRKKRELNALYERLDSGLIKLHETADMVAKLRTELEAEQVEIGIKQLDTEKLLEEVSKETAVAEENQAFVTGEREKMSVMQAECSELASSCAKDLEAAEPAVKAAEAALKTLDKKSLTEMKSFATPPKEVETVANAVAILLSTPGQRLDLSWAGAKKMMGQIDKFLQQLLTYDKENIPDSTLKSIQPFIDDPTFNGPNLKSKSLAASGLCEWVRNIVAYYTIYRYIKPKREKLDTANAQLAEANAKLAEMQANLDEINARLAELTEKFEVATDEKNTMISESAKTVKRLSLAERLIDGLAGENVRWQEGVVSLKDQLRTVVGDALLASAFVSYVGALTIDLRAQIVSQWLENLLQMNIPLQSGLDPVTVLSSPTDHAGWCNEGLPSDLLSIQNASIVTKCSRWPLLIDPQLQGVTWLKGRPILLDPATSKIVSITDAKLLLHIENCVTNGYCLLIENVGETIDAVLDPIISRATFKKGRTVYVQLGDKELPYDPNFCLLLQTKIANPHYKPEVCAQVTLVNFCVTMDGLEEQLLAVVVDAERPDLEQQRVGLVRQQNLFKIKIKELEDSLLQRLSAAEGDIIADIELIENLETTKTTATEIAVKADLAAKTQIVITEARDFYRPAAIRGSLLYFLIDRLPTLDHMYQFSLKKFLTIFKDGIIKAAPQPEPVERLTAIITSIMHLTSVHVLQALFEKDKLSFVTQLCFSIKVRDGSVSSAAVECLIRGRKVISGQNPIASWLPDSGWQMVCALAKEFPENMERLSADLVESKRWRDWIVLDRPEEEKLPGDWRNLPAFERLMIIRALRPDRVVNAVKIMVNSELADPVFINPPPLNVQQVIADAGVNTPIMFILSPGVDPTSVVEAAADKRGLLSQGKFLNVSLGQGQEGLAVKAIQTAIQDGCWVMLQNVHLMPKWLNVLDNLIEDMIPEKVNKYFQLFLSAEPSRDIPIQLLQRCLKITNEPPQGLQANMIRAFGIFKDEVLEQSQKPAEFKSTVFALSFFHAVIVERRKFGAQGWNRVYPFNLGDLSVCGQVLRNYLDEQPKIPWDDLKYIFGEIMYGGHITDDWDRILCNSYLDMFVRPQVLEGMELFSGFPIPSPTDHTRYMAYIQDMPSESPACFGMHANAEIGHRMEQTSDLFSALVELVSGSTGVGSGADSRMERIKLVLDDVTEHLPGLFDLYEIIEKVEDRGNPHVNVFLQECQYINNLVGEIGRSLRDTDAALSGTLTITSSIEETMNALAVDAVPRSWTACSWPSLRSLGPWMIDLVARHSQLSAWSTNPVLPLSTWLSGFVNPQSFITAVLQSASRKSDWPLDKVALLTDVSKVAVPAELTVAPPHGAYVHGFYLQGARWSDKLQALDDPLPGQLLQGMPLILLKAVLVKDLAQATRECYICPVYKTQKRGSVSHLQSFTSMFYVLTCYRSHLCIFGSTQNEGGFYHVDCCRLRNGLR
jgi:dynein heavy chain